VGLVRTDISQEIWASIIRVEGISELGTMLAVTNTHCEETLTLLMVATRSYQNIDRHIQEHGIIRFSYDFPF
jgi:hypothetical protein